MQAIKVEAAGGVEQLKLVECPLPECAPGEVLVEMKAAGINYIDIYTREGLYKPASYPYIPGKEGSGVVKAVGREVHALKPGDRVAFCVGGTGTYAEYACLPAEQVVPIPSALSFENAAAVMLQGLTAYYLSHLTFPLNHQQTALIHAGAGGVGLLLIQMAKLLNAKVITTVSSADKAALVKQAGADEVIIYTRESFLDGVMSLTQNKGVNVVYDAVGKTTWTDSLKSLAIRGMMVSYGQASGVIPPFEVAQLATKSLFLSRPVLGHYTQTRDELMSMSSDLFDLISQEKIKVTIGQRYSLAEVQQAHADLAGRKTIGKSILVF